MDAKDYFKISEMYEKLCEEVMISLCKNCPHRIDSHTANCCECCPLTRAKEKVLNKTLGDNVIHGKGRLRPEALYANESTHHGKV